MRWKRWLLVTLAVLLVLAGGLFVAARIYLRSSAVAGRVAKELADTLGVPVRVGEADVGVFGKSTVRNVRVHEPDADAWLTVDEVSTDVSALDVIRGAVRPKRVTLKGVKAELRLDKEGEVLTK